MRLDIDNSVAEPKRSGDSLPQAARRANEASQNLIRTIKPGLKNWLFIGNAEAGPASALLCNLLVNCHEQTTDPERYFEETLRRIPIKVTVEKAAELTPAKLAPPIRELQPRPAYRDKQSKVAAQRAAA